MLKEGAQANALDDSGRTATIWAVESNSNAAIKHLLIDASKVSPMLKPAENNLLSINNDSSLKMVDCYFINPIQPYISLFATPQILN